MDPSNIPRMDEVKHVAHRLPILLCVFAQTLCEPLTFTIARLVLELPNARRFRRASRIEAGQRLY